MKDLSPKQRRFAELVGLEGIAKAEAWRRAYEQPNAAIQKASTAGSELARNPKVAAVIEKFREDRKKAALERVTMSIEELVSIYIAIALTDPNELVQVRIGCCRHCWGMGGQYQWREIEYMQAVAEWQAKMDDPRVKTKPPMPHPAGGLGFNATLAPNPKCTSCDGEGEMRMKVMDTTKLSPGARHLYRGAQMTKDGLKIRFADKDKTLENIGRTLGAFDDRLALKLDEKLASLRQMPADPAEAGRAYQELIAQSRMQ